MRLFVTGGSGFVGSYLIEAALRRGDIVVAAGREGRWRRIAADVPSRVPLYAWDVGEPASDALVRTLRDFAPTAILHLAAVSIPVDCGGARPTDEAWRTNVLGTRRVLELAAQLPSVQRFLLASSCHVYRVDPAVSIRVGEDAPLGPTQGYGITKLEAERLVQQSVGAFSRLIVRGFQRTGPGQPARLIVPEWLEKVRRGDDPVRVRAVQTSLDLADVRDAVELELQLLSRPEVSGVVNVATGRATTGSGILEGLGRLANRSLRVESEIREPRFNPIAEIDRLRGWVTHLPFRDLDETLREMWLEVDTGGATRGVSAGPT